MPEKPQKRDFLSEKQREQLDESVVLKEMLKDQKNEAKKITQDHSLLEGSLQDDNFRKFCDTILHVVE